MNFFNLVSLNCQSVNANDVQDWITWKNERPQIEEVHFSGRAILFKYHFFLLKIYNNQLESGHLYPIFGFWKRYHPFCLLIVQFFVFLTGKVTIKKFAKDRFNLLMLKIFPCVSNNWLSNRNQSWTPFSTSHLWKYVSTI